MTRTQQTARRFLGLYLLLLVYDGALRKWALPSAEKLLFVLKDALLLIALAWAIAQLRKPRPSALPPGPRYLFGAYAAWVTLQVGNLNLPSPLVGLWGWKAHLLQTTLVLLIPLAYSSLSDFLESLGRLYAWLVIPVAVLGFMQLAAGPSSPLNVAVRGGEESLAFFGEASLVRVTGPFSYVTGMVAFIQGAALLGFGIFIGGVRSRSFLLGFFFMLALLPATGSRSVVVVSAVSGLLMIGAAFIGGLINTKLTLRMLAAMGILGSLSYWTQRDVWVALQQRAIGSSGDEQRTFTAFTNAFSYFEVSGVLGFGTGAANLGSPALVDVRPFSWLPPGTVFEEESGRLVLELGILGWALGLAMRVSFASWALALSLQGRSRIVRVAGIISLPVSVLGAYQGNGAFASPVASAHYWLCIALLAMAQHQHRATPRITMTSSRRDVGRAQGAHA